MNMIELFSKYRTVIAYLFFGACATVVNVAVYWLSFTVFAVPNVPYTVIAWIVSVLFAFITNKLWVFKSRGLSRTTLFREIASFFTCRLLTGLLDVAIMFIAVDTLKQNALLWKIISNAIVIILNYIASRYFIFLKPKKNL